MIDPPIEPLDFLSGVTVIDIGDVRVSRGLSRRHRSSCPHQRMHYDSQERRIWCPDCETNVDPFDAFLMIIEPLDRARKTLDRREKQLTEAEQFQVRSRAAKAIDKEWRKRGSVPACPHCNQGLFPEDFADGVRVKLGRDYAEAARKRKAATLPTEEPHA